MRHLVPLVLAIAVLVTPAAARAARPARGGRYVGRVHVGPGTNVRVDLVLANHGKEFADGSAVSAAINCGGGTTFDTDIFLTDLFPLSRSVKVHSTGTFRFKGEGGRVSGRFTNRGRVARGSFAFPAQKLQNADTSCPDVSAAFEAHLVGRPNTPRPGAPSSCDRVSVAFPHGLDGDEAYAPFERAMGCTAAREAARRWHASRSCRRLAAGSCAIPHAVCGRIRGGRLRSLASVRCTSTSPSHGIVEPVHYQPCRPAARDRSSMSLWAINLKCSVARAFPVQQLIGNDDADTAPCGRAIYILSHRLTCKPVAGFSCTVHPEAFGPNFGFGARCVEVRDRFLALEFDYDFG